jgi:hypothetical protein
MSLGRAPSRPGPYLTRDGRVAIVEKAERVQMPNEAVGSISVVRRHGYIVGQHGRKITWKASGHVTDARNTSGRDLVAWIGGLEHYVGDDV